MSNEVIEETSEGSAISSNTSDLTRDSGKATETSASNDKTQLNQEESRNTSALESNHSSKFGGNTGVAYQPTSFNELNPRDEKFVDLVAKGESVRGAYIQSGHKATQNAGVNAAQSLARPYIMDALAERRSYFRSLANVEAEEIIGAQTELAFADITNAFDEEGNFDFAKAKETGATRLIKKVSTQYNKHGKSVNVELYSRADALDKLAEMLGLKKAPALNNARTRLLDAIEKVMRVENLSFPQAYEYIAQRQKEGEVQLFSDELMKQVAEERGIVIQQLGTTS